MASLPGLFNFQAFSDLGLPLVGGRLYTYAAGTTTQKVAYTDAAGTIPHTYVSDGQGGLYIALNTRGELPAPLFLSSGGYDIALKTALGATVWTRRATGQDDATSILAADLANVNGTATKGGALVGIRMPGLNMLTRSLYALALERGYSILDTGAVSDGVLSDGGSGTDNTTAIQTCIDQAWLALNTMGTSDFGNKVIVPPGIFFCTGKIIQRPGIEIVGAGMLASQLVWPTTYAGTCVEQSALVPPYSNVNGYPTTIRDLGIVIAQGGSTNNPIGLLQNKNSSYAEKVWFSGFLGANGSGVVQNIADCFVTNCVLEYCTYPIQTLAQSCHVTETEVFLCTNGPVIQNEPRYTAQAGTSTTIRLPSSFTSTNDAVKNWEVRIVSGTGAGQFRKVTAYNGTTKDATVSPAWSTAPDATSVFTILVENGPVVYSDVRVLQSDSIGFWLLNCGRVQMTNCSVSAFNGDKFVNGGLVALNARAVEITTFKGVPVGYSDLAMNSAPGISLTSCDNITINGGQLERWANNLLIAGCNSVTVKGLSSQLGKLRNLLINGGDRITISGGDYSNAGVGGTAGVGIEDNNTTPGAVHTFANLQANGAAGTQAYGAKFNCGSTSFTYVSGVLAPYNLTKNIDYSGTVGNIFTDGVSSIGRQWAPLDVSGLATITLPQGSCFSSGGVVQLTGTSGTTITNITATGYAGARVTLATRSGLTYSFSSAGNILNGGGLTITNTAARDLICDGTSWQFVL